MIFLWRSQSLSVRQNGTSCDLSLFFISCNLYKHLCVCVRACVCVCVCVQIDVFEVASEVVGTLRSCLKVTRFCRLTDTIDSIYYIPGIVYRLR